MAEGNVSFAKLFRIFNKSREFLLGDHLIELIQRLLNALEPGTYLPPHRHTDKEETYVVLRGSLLTFFYDDLGNVIEKVNLNPSVGVYGVEIPSGTWHSIIALEPGTVIFEIKSGPYKPLPPEDIAPWAPAPSDLEGAAVFMKRMLEV